MKQPRNSFEAVKFVLDHAPKDLTLTQRAVLTQIAHHYPTPHLSQATLAAEIGARRVDTVNRAVQVLVKRELLIVKRQGQARANKYELNYGSNVYGETASMTTRQTVYHVYGQTVLKQTINKKENKEGFFDFLKSFPNSTISEHIVFKAYQNALTKGVTEDELVTASRANKEMLTPTEFLNFEKWKSYKPERDEIAELREMSI
jgi:hypothetical protein